MSEDWNSPYWKEPVSTENAGRLRESPQINSQLITRVRANPMMLTITPVSATMDVLRALAVGQEV